MLDLVHDVLGTAVEEKWANELLCAAASVGCLPTIRRLMDNAQQKTEVKSELFRSVPRDLSYHELVKRLISQLERPFERLSERITLRWWNIYYSGPELSLIFNIETSTARTFCIWLRGNATQRYSASRFPVPRRVYIMKTSKRTRCSCESS